MFSIAKMASEIALIESVLVIQDIESNELII